MKVNELDEAETDFIDVDIVISFYIDDYKKLRKANQINIIQSIKSCLDHNVNLKSDLSIKDVKRLLSLIIPTKSTAPNILFAKEVTI